MHEMGIASSVLDAVDRELRGYPGQRATRIGLRIGEFAGVDAESLRFCFEALVMDSALAPLTLDIEICRVEDGGRGDELDLAYLELENGELENDVACAQEAAV
jgi:hydrogenase nickel incorporation protein HypA/HybF